MNILVAGGAGFIGSHFVSMLCRDELKMPDRHNRITIIDSLIYSGRYENIQEYIDNKKVLFYHSDIRDINKINDLPKKYDVIFNFAAQTHVDNSISSPGVFIDSNIVGMHELLNFAYSNSTDTFVQISTDEVYGSLLEDSATEIYPLLPSSPYSASKASADLLALSYYKTYKYDIRITRCTNNYGIRQFPEKIIPFFIKRIIENKNLPIYGSGLQVRNWIHVKDHCRGIWLSYINGIAGNVYNFAGDNEVRNLDLAQKIIDITESQVKIEFIEDRKGHDFRYSVNDEKARKLLKFIPEVNFEIGLKNTIDWYLLNADWVKSRDYKMNKTL